MTLSELKSHLASIRAAADAAKADPLHLRALASELDFRDKLTGCTEHQAQDDLRAFADEIDASRASLPQLARMLEVALEALETGLHGDPAITRILNMEGEG